MRTLFVLLALAGVSLRADDNDIKSGVVFRSDVSLVRVDAQVLDRDNRAITGLRPEDFVLRDEGQVRPIRHFAREDMPVDLVFLLDVSASMRPHVERIANAAHDALRVMGKDDRVAILVFDRSTRVRMPFRGGAADVLREFDNLLHHERFDGGTDITRGLVDAANFVAKNARKEARRAIVILTDDQTERERDEAKVSRALVKADAVLSALIAPDAMAGRQYPRGGGGGRYPGGGYPGGGGRYPGGGYPGGGPIGGPLGGIILGRRGGGGYPRGGGGPVMTGPHTQSAGTSEIARESGGDSMPVDDAAALETTLSRIRQRYALYFNAPDGVRGGQERNIEVALADTARRRYPDADLRYRRVYMAPEGGATTAVASSQPGTVSQQPAATAEQATGTSSDPVVIGAPSDQRRRRAVSEPESRRGPIQSGDQAPAAQSNPDTPPAQRGGWRRAEPADSTPPPSDKPAQAAPADKSAQADPADKPAQAAPSDKKDADPPATGGWRKVKPGEQP